MFGPLWGTSTFPCEDGIGQVLHLVSAAKFVAVQAKKVPHTFALHLCLKEVFKGEAKRLAAKLEGAWTGKGSNLIVSQFLRLLVEDDFTGGSGASERAPADAVRM